MPDGGLKEPYDGRMAFFELLPFFSLPDAAHDRFAISPQRLKLALA